MLFSEFQKRERFGQDEIVAYARGSLLEDAPPGLPALPGFTLLPFHEISRLEWDEASGSGVIEAVRDNRFDDWFYGCHFPGDPVMPGCWGVDAVWQCLRFFAAWRGLSGCGRALGMEDVSFFGQIRPRDRRIRYLVEVTGVEREDGETLITGKASVEVDGVPVYSIGRAQVGTAYWQAPEEGPRLAPEPAPGAPLRRRLRLPEFSAKESLSREELVALSMGTLVDEPAVEIGLLPAWPMLEIGRVERIARDAAGEGEMLASRSNSPLEWFYAMSPAKPTALSIDAVWQMLGLFLAWSGRSGTGRALGFERVEVFDEIRPDDRDIRYEARVLRATLSGETGDAFVRADARVFADGRPILQCSNANVGCHKDIRYLDYPVESEMAFGGRLKTRAKEVSR